MSYASEVSVSPGMFPGSTPATAGDGSGEVSRGHIRCRNVLKGRILKCKEQSERTRMMWSGSKGMTYQTDLFDEALMKAIRPVDDGNGSTGAVPIEEPQASSAFTRQRALTTQLMEQVAGSANLNQAYKRVKANKGVAGVDGMTVDDLLPWLAENKETLVASLTRDAACKAC